MEQRSRQDAREERELAYWRDHEAVSEGPEWLEILVNKMSEAGVLLEKFAAYDSYFGRSNSILEVGGGQGWAACMTARSYPQARVTTTDISPQALEALPEWARILGVPTPASVACTSYDLPLEDGEVDLVFAFAAAHHFGRHRATLKEIARVLRPGGTALYLHEPSCRDYLYRAAVRRVNRKRPVVDEDVLRYPRIIELGREAGLNGHVQFAPTTTYRRPKETVYYLALQNLPLLQRTLPCSADFIFHKER